MNVVQTPSIAATELFQAFSEPVRLRILALMRGPELCVCHLVDVLELPQPTISRHLTQLQKLGLIHCRKQGTWHYYQLSPPHSWLHEKLLDCLAVCRQTEAICQDDWTRWQRVAACATSTGGCGQ